MLFHRLILAFSDLNSQNHTINESVLNCFIVHAFPIIGDVLKKNHNPYANENFRLSQIGEINLDYINFF